MRSLTGLKSTNRLESRFDRGFSERLECWGVEHQLGVRTSKDTMKPRAPCYRCASSAEGLPHRRRWLRDRIALPLQIGSAIMAIYRIFKTMAFQPEEIATMSVEY
jgi:hypothetical protein